MLEEAKGEQRSMRNLILRLLMNNFVAMHTASMVRICFRMSMLLTEFFVQAFTQALYYLAANPEYAVALREEVNAVVGEYSWTKAAIDRMYRIDSFIRESQRLDPVGTSEFNSARNLQIDVNVTRRSVSSPRIALKDFVFSDGVHIPAGTFVCLPLYATHHAEGKYPDPFTFDPNRFISSPQGHGTASTAEKEGGPRPHQLVTASADYLAWGLGRHAWYVRWFLMVCLQESNTYFIAPEGGLRQQSSRRCLRTLWRRMMSS